MATNTRNFNVRANKDAAERSVSIKVPATFADLTDEQRSKVLEKALQSFVIDVQGGLRRRLSSERLTDEQLATAAQTLFDNALNGVRAAAKTVVQTIDVSLMFPDGKVNAAQLEVLKALLAQGAKLSNVPEDVMTKLRK